MIIQDNSVPVETQGKITSQDFSISNASLIINYMTESIYSNPILAICREIMSNARDAHIEQNKANVPITVKLPNRLLPTYEVIDKGSGITPDRMVSVYTKYGASTKRTNNQESGGFGLGCKVPWSKYDSFNIITTSVEHDGVMRRRQYAAIKGDSNNPPRLMEMGEPVEDLSPEERQTGTTISMEVPPEDFPQFIENTLSVALWWKTQPIITGLDPIPKYKTYDTLYEGTGWRIINFHSYEYNRPSYITIDGIPYPLKWSSLDMHNIKNKDLNFLESLNVIVEFNVGELTVNLNREEIRYTEETKKKIIDRLHEVNKFLLTTIETKIKGAKNLWEAYIEYVKADDVISGMKKVKWNGIELRSSNFEIPWESPYSITQIYNNPNTRKKITHTRHINIREENVLFVNDEPKFSYLRIQQYFIDHPKTKYAYVLEYDPNHRTIIDPKLNAEWNKWVTLSGFDKLEPIVLSTIPKRVIDRSTLGRNATPKTVNKVYILNEAAIFDPVTIDLKEEEGVYVTVERKECVNYSNSNLLKIKLGINQPIYGIPDRFQSQLGPKWTTLNDYVEKWIDKTLKSLDTDKLSVTYWCTESIKDVFVTLSGHLTSSAFIKKLQDGPIKEWVNIDNYKLSNNDKHKYQAIKLVYESLGKDLIVPKTKQVEDLLEQIQLCHTIYPLLAACNNYDFIHSKVSGATEELAHYCNYKSQIYLSQLNTALTQSVNVV